MPNTFTLSYSKNLGKHPKEINTEIEISSPLLEKPNFIAVDAVWDTGATRTCVSPNIIEDLGLSPISSTMVIGVNNSQKTCPIYFILLKLPNGQTERLPVISTEIGGSDILIGMDIISKVDFMLSRDSDGDVYFTLRFPALEKHI